METKNFKLIHVGKIQTSDGFEHLYLRKKNDNEFRWYEFKNQEEKETEVSSINIEEAMRLAFRYWKSHFFHPLNCGFRYTLPERDEHGINALFHQMVSSYSSMNGIYYDEELGSNCFVQNASIEARGLWQTLKKENRI